MMNFKSKSKSKSQSNINNIKPKLYLPRYWFLWIITGLLWLIIQLPYFIQLKIGKYLGLLGYYFSKREKNIARVNIALCFPELDLTTQKKLLKNNFISAGQSSIETVFSWWASTKRLEKLIHIKGLDNNIINYLNNNNQDNNNKNKNNKKSGLLIFTPHFTCIHAVGRLINLKHPFSVMYFPPKNPVFRYISERALPHHYEQAIPRNNPRALIKALKNNQAVLYTPDIDAGKKGLFVPFFNILASSVTASSRFVTLTGCKIIPANYYRRKDNKGFNVEFYPALENFPDKNNNLYQDSVSINQILESFIKQHPEQYLWAYKRFKTRPEKDNKFY